MSGFQSGGNLGNGGASEAEKTDPPASTQPEGEKKKETHSISNSMSYLEAFTNMPCTSLPRKGTSGGSYNEVAPPSTVQHSQVRKHDPFAPPSSYNSTGYTSMTAVEDQLSTLQKKRIINEDDYFEDDEAPAKADDGYQPAPGSPGGGDSDDDPLEAFMAGIEKELKKDDSKSDKQKEKEKDKKATRDDIDELDEQEAYFKWLEENPEAGLQKEEEDFDIEYDADGNPIYSMKKTVIDPLPQIDHSEIVYEKFEKNFYVEHPEILHLSPFEVESLRRKLGLKISGYSAAKPVSSFAHFGFEERLLSVIRKSEYTQPTPIQAQGCPIILGGRDVIGIAKTGSGKTAAFVWPMLFHVMDQRALKAGEGPIALICAPTRELAQQIEKECKRFGKPFGISTVCAYGGGSKWDQSNAVKEGCEVLVCTPGRLIDLVKMKAMNLERVTYLVFDEADRCFDMGFEPQVRSIANHVRPTRQTLLFSATFKRRIEKLARDILNDPIRIVQGDAIGEANENVAQHVFVMKEPSMKWQWLTKNIVKFTSIGSVLIFVTKKINSEELAENLKKQDVVLELLHGDMHQVDRNNVIARFKKKDFPVLVATDVAARGLDIPHIKTVVNYDIARDIDTHTHRIGRTGRAGEAGDAFTLIVPKDKEFAGHLVRNLESVNQNVTKELMDLALGSSWFRNSRCKGGKGKQLAILGTRERPGLGSAGESSDGGGGGVGGGGSVSMPGGTTAEAREAMGATKGSSAAIMAITGQKTNRVAAIRSAFIGQYKNNFQSAGVDRWEDEIRARAMASAKDEPQDSPREEREEKEEQKKSILKKASDTKEENMYSYGNVITDDMIEETMTRQKRHYPPPPPGYNAQSSHSSSSSTSYPSSYPSPSSSSASSGNFAAPPPPPPSQHTDSSESDAASKKKKRRWDF